MGWTRSPLPRRGCDGPDDDRVLRAEARHAVAGVVGPDRVLEVIGRRSVTIIDGANSETDAWEVKAYRPLMISNVILHSLPSGYRFDLERRERLSAPMLRALDVETLASS